MCGDSMDETDILKLISGKNWKTHCISDPPYWISYDNKREWQWMIKNDDKILDYCWLAKKHTDGFFAMRTGYQVVDKRKQLIENTFDKLNNMIIRHKWGGWLWDCARTLAQDFEILLVVNRGNEIQWYRWWSTRYRQQQEKEKFIEKASKEMLKTVLTEVVKWESVRKVGKDNNMDYIHPTQKPIGINERVLENFTAEWDNVLDLFGWSWSNLIACEKNKRKCYMMELDEKYAQVIINRFHKYTWWKEIIKCLNRDIKIDDLLLK